MLGSSIDFASIRYQTFQPSESQVVAVDQKTAHVTYMSKAPIDVP